MTIERIDSDKWARIFRPVANPNTGLLIYEKKAEDMVHVEWTLAMHPACVWTVLLRGADTVYVNGFQKGEDVDGYFITDRPAAAGISWEIFEKDEDDDEEDEELDIRRF